VPNALRPGADEFANFRNLDEMNPRAIQKTNEADDHTHQRDLKDWFVIDRAALK